MMSFTETEAQALGSIADGLAGSDPRLASMLTIFSRLAAGEEMPVREKTRVRRGRPTALRPRRARRYTRGGLAFRQPRRRTRGWAGSRPCCCQRPQHLRPADGNGVPSPSIAQYAGTGGR